MSEAQITHSEESEAQKLQVCLNMYIACSYFVKKARPLGKAEKAIKEECLNFLATMIYKIDDLHKEQTK
jgi:hypothetical protein